MSTIKLMTLLIAGCGLAYVTNYLFHGAFMNQHGIALDCALVAAPLLASLTLTEHRHH